MKLPFPLPLCCVIYYVGVLLCVNSIDDHNSQITKWQTLIKFKNQEEPWHQRHQHHRNRQSHDFANENSNGKWEWH